MMKVMCLVLTAVMLTVFQAGCNVMAAEPGVQAGGKTDYVIVIPARPTTQERQAAEELAQWLGEVTGAAFPTVSDAAPPRATEISVGRTSRLAIVDIPAAKKDLGDEGYAIAVQGQRRCPPGGRRHA